MSMARYRPILASLRLISGMALLCYITTHLFNHALGIFGLEFIQNARINFIAIWRSPLLYWVVPVSLIVHAGLALTKLLTKKTYRGLSRREWLQLVLGLSIPSLLIPHIYHTRIASMAFGVQDSYASVLLFNQDDMVIGLLLNIVVVWLHAHIGLHAYLGQKPWYGRVRRPLEAAALLLPALAIAGTVVVARDVRALERTPAQIMSVIRTSNPRNIAVGLHENYFTERFSAGYLGLLVAAFSLRYLLLSYQSRRNLVQVQYLSGKRVSIPKGATLLEASLRHNIPHAHVCGGRGRCSTCRVQVIEHAQQLSPPSEAELKVLRRVGAEANVRLACQAVPDGSCVIHPLLPHTSDVATGFRQSTRQQGSDQEIAILFADLRGFTTLSEHKLPYDTVFILNQYFQTMGQVIEQAGGYIDKFIGDGIMALFGLERGIEQGCREALAAAQGMAHQLDLLNRQLEHAVSAPLALGIGIHCGHVIVGDMGYKHTKHLTAIGDAVNSAARLESATKEQRCQLIVSKEVVDYAGADLATFQTAEIELRGRTQSLQVYLVPSAKEYAVG